MPSPCTQGLVFLPFRKVATKVYEKKLNFSQGITPWGDLFCILTQKTSNTM
jgi:hypothetical protein